ncbi:fasciclin domain-containing protein [Pontibacter sp. MBLB2868]|uniref:fasciclin domain-containing protein n=1 Tax=Pontibacter sp. MBLB2868 TaxID=3451555 RepID=UPI003F75263A
MKGTKLFALGISMLCSTMLFSCGNNEERMENPIQEETKPNPGAQEEAKMTNPNTPGRIAGGGKAEGGTKEVDLTMTDPDVGGHEMMPSQKLVENITSAPTLTTLASALRKADLVRTLNATGPYTVFAPTNEAFDALPDDVIEDLMRPENKQQLVEILNNHVVAGRLTADNLQDGAMLKTVGGEQLKVTKRNNKIMINGAEVIIANAQSDNGVIHVINKVLMPAEK